MRLIVPGSQDGQPAPATVDAAAPLAYHRRAGQPPQSHERAYVPLAPTHRRLPARRRGMVVSRVRRGGAAEPPAAGLSSRSREDERRAAPRRADPADDVTAPPVSAGSLAPVAQQIGPRFNVVSAVPTTIFVAFVAVLVASGAPELSPSLSTATRELGSLSIGEVGMLLVGAIALGLVLHPLQYALVQALEGYWAPVGPLGVAAEMGRQRHLARKKRLQMLGTAQPASVWERLAPALVERRRRYATARYEELPFDETRIMPTRLGNVLRHAEDLAGDRYGLDAIEIIPRLYAVAAPAMVERMDDARNGMDIAARFVLVWLMATIVSLALLAPHGFWLAVPVATYLLAMLAYRGSIAAARDYGRFMIWMVDLYRFDLLEQLRFETPLTHADELKLNSRIHTLLVGGRREQQRPTLDRRAPPPRYKHPPAR
jgi:hypothetical protein